MSTVVVGGGIAGLTVAFRLASRGEEVVLLESSDRLGGAIRTRSVGGVLVECGPQTATASAPALRLMGELGLREQVIWPSDAAKRRYVLKNGGLVPLPHSIASLMGTPLLGPLEVARLFVEPLVAADEVPGETVAAFVERRLGRAVAREFIEPFVAGVFGGDPSQLEVATAFARLVDMERNWGSLLGAALLGEADPKPSWVKGPMFSVSGGMETIVHRLAERLGGRILLGERVRGIHADNAGVRVEAEEGSFEAERAVVCVSPHRLVEGWVDPPRAPLVAVHLAWPRESIGRSLDGFGWLAPARERRDALGALWVSATMPSHAPGRALVRVMMGGVRDPSAADLTDEEAVVRARRVVREVEGISADPDVVHVHRAHPGIPQYPPGHRAMVASLQSSMERVHWLGWEVSGIGLSHIFAAAERM